MNLVRKYPAWSVLGSFIIGWIIGLVLFGWYIWPVEWTDATPGQLAPQYQEAWVRAVAELYAFNGNAEMVQQALGGWAGDATGDQVACTMAAGVTDPAERARLEAVASVVNGGAGCSGVITATPVGGGETGDAEVGGETAADEEGGAPGWLLPAFMLLLLLGLVVAAILWVLNSRHDAAEASVSVEPVFDESDDVYARPAAAATAVQASRSDDVTTVPIARFHTTYTYGNDAYDDSFSIENASSEFLGECGVGIAETIGGDVPKKVTALEIWLFDKKDIRTITKVVMSDHAFFDDALKAKLAPKGEPVLAREGETIVLETASLIINAEITEMLYGNDNDRPPQSYFDRITIALSAWAKENGGSTYSASSDVDDLMDF
ncbi:MAG: hypothetical protein ACK2T4_00110 [Candidatus Promineifilaceae bacterium]|jgi:hypothetical protein